MHLIPLLLLSDIDGDKGAAVFQKLVATCYNVPTEVGLALALALLILS